MNELPSESSSPQTSYVFDNAAEQSRRRFKALPSIFDAGTIRHLSAVGVSPGWNCLEVGAGNGSIAEWLAERVGPSGHVLATDIDVRFLEGLGTATLEIRRHDVTKDPLPEEAFDVIHARLVLMHFPEREHVLARLVSALKPGGWFVGEDFDGQTVRAEPRLDPAQALLKVLDVMRRVLIDRGVDPLWGRKLPAAMRALGLRDIETEGRIFIWQGGSLGADMVRANLEQLREPILATGLISEAEFNADLTRLLDPSLTTPSPIMWASRGRRAPG